MTDCFQLERLALFPTDFQLPRLFREHVSSYMAPIYFETATEISHEFDIRFLHTWAWEAENLMREHGWSESAGGARSYATNSRKLTIPGASFRLSEIYKTAFLRTLAWFYKKGEIDIVTFQRNSMRFLPVDLSLWEVGTQARPTWWPALYVRGAAEIGSGPTLQAIDWDPIRSLTNIRTTINSSPARILAAEGKCSVNSDDVEEKLAARFSLFGFAYATLGPNLPHPSLVARDVLYDSFWWANSQTRYAIRVLDGAAESGLGHSQLDWNYGRSMHVWSLVSRFRMPTIGTWQWFRGYDAVFGLSSFFDPSKVRLSKNDLGWSYEEEARRVATIYDWRNGSLDRDVVSGYPAHGQAIEIASDWLEEKLSERGLRLGFILRVSVKVRKYNYDDAKETHHAEFLDVGKVII
jgi:hypothetical protein